MSRDRARSLRRRLRKAEAWLPIKSPEQVERERLTSQDYALHFMQACYLADGFRGLARYWRYRVRPETSDADLLDLVREWARRFKAANEQLHAALLAAREGLADPFRDWDQFSEVHHGYGFDKHLDHWLKTNPPRWEIAVALDLSRASPLNDPLVKPNPMQRPLVRDIEAVDAYYNGPRTRRRKAELGRIRRELGA